MEIELTKENYDGEVIKSNMPVLVDFWASWCGPCKMVAPIISQIAEEYNGKVKVCKVNVDDQGDAPFFPGAAQLTGLAPSSPSGIPAKSSNIVCKRSPRTIITRSSS